jgi:hypothetical protein
MAPHLQNVLRPLVGAALMALVGCGDPTPREQFDDEVVPVLEGYCLGSNCHGVAPGAEEGGDVIDWSFFHVRVTDSGTILDTDQAYATAKGRINKLEHPALSTLLRKPLAADSEGLVHLGGTQFRDGTASGYQTILRWIQAESEGGEGESFDALTPLQQQFASDVLPHLAMRQCMNRACHGAFSPFTRFEAPVVVDGEPIFSVEATRKNYRASRMHLFLGGSPEQSRLLRKALPIGAGGMAHRGGNAIFFGDMASEPSRALIDWAEAEREEILGESSSETSAIVFVRGPVGAATAFEHDGFQPGTDLWVLQPPEPGGATRNLTAAAHPDGPADVRDPAVNHDGTRVAFAMRRSSEAAFNIFDMRLDGGDLRQLTSDVGPLPGGARAANVQPTYGPDGRVYFTSTRAGTLADGLDVVDSEIWAVDPADGRLERLTYNPFPEVTPSFIGHGKNYGTLSFTMRRTLGGRFEAPVFRTPLDHNKAFHGDSEVHIHHGVTLDGEIVYGMRTLPDGRFSCVLLDRDNVWRGGRLAVFDRQLGPEITIGQEDTAAVGGYRHAFTILSDGSVSSGGSSPGGLFRHPVPLPDGRLLVSHAAGPIDLDDPSGSPDMGLYLASLVDNSASGEPEMNELALLLDEPGVSEYDAEPVVVRPLEDDPAHEHGWDSERVSSTGTLAFRHVETLEAIMSNLSQVGLKVLRNDLAYLRLIEALPVTPEEQASAPVGLGVHGRSRILGEVPLLGGSVFLEVPADVPFRVQYLNDERMAVGAQHNRWVHVAPDEKFPGGVAPELFPTLCAGCHGAFSGDRGDVGGPVPDIIAAASVTLATHENMNPRRPRERVRVGDELLSVDFQRDLLPLLTRSCAVSGCHRAPEPAGDLSLEAVPTALFDTAFEALLQLGDGSGGGRRYVDALGSSARNSHLIERLYGRELDADRQLGEGCEGKPPLSTDELLLFVRWIDLGAVYRGTAP